MNERMYYSAQAEQEARREKLLLVLVSVGLSVSISTMLAMLFAPQSGDKTRQMIADSVKDALDKGQAAAQSAGEQIRESAESLRSDANM